MKKTKLKELLFDIAGKDLVEGANLIDHPCIVAAKAIDQCFDDIDYLKQILNNKQTIRAKRAVHLIKLNYNPDY